MVTGQLRTSPPQGMLAVLEGGAGGASWGVWWACCLEEEGVMVGKVRTEFVSRTTGRGGGVHGHPPTGAGVGVGVGCMGRQGRGMLAVEEGGAGGMLRDVLWPCCTAWPHDGRPARPGSLLGAV
jgi:hypothetical protein